MRSRLPFDALRTFAEIAGGASAAQAAARLNITPGAVSQRIAALETHLGRKLVERRGRHLTPTGDGAALYESVRDHLAALEAALQAGPVERRLRIHATPGFAEAWLLPRLKAIAALVEPMAVELVTSAAPFEATARWSARDVAIRYGAAFAGDLVATPLVPSQIALVARPDVAGTECAALVATMPLLRQPGLDEWPVWLDDFGVPPRKVHWGPHLTDDAAALGAAALGHGIASVRTCNLGGRTDLRVLARRRAPGGATYHLLSRRSDLAAAPIGRLHAWARGGG